MKIKSLFLYAVVLFLFSSKVFAGAISSGWTHIDIPVKDLGDVRISTDGFSEEELRSFNEFRDGAIEEKAELVFD